MPVGSTSRSFPANFSPRASLSCARPLVMVAWVAAAIGGLAASAQGTVTNGSFEQPTVAVGSYAIFSGGSTAITGWTVLGDRVAVINTTYVESGVTYNAQDGDQWIDLTGPGSNSPANGVSQDVATVMGQMYRISFYVGSANNTGVSASTVDLSIAGGARVSFTNPIAPSTMMDWQLFTADFVATGALTNITFFNGSTSNNNLSGLDNVTLEVIPTPGAAALLALGGLMASGGRRRRA